MSQNQTVKMGMVSQNMKIRMNVSEYSPERQDTKRASDSSRLHKKASISNMNLPLDSVDL